MRSGFQTLGTVVLLVMVLLTVECAHKPAQAPIPGSIDSFDSWAFRIVDDSDAAIHRAKIWEQCTALSTPTVNIDGKTESCKDVSHPFPMAYKGDLNSAIDALNIAKAAGAAYHSGASKDTQAMLDAINRLSAAVGILLNHIGVGASKYEILGYPTPVIS